MNNSILYHFLFLRIILDLIVLILYFICSIVIKILKKYSQKYVSKNSTLFYKILQLNSNDSFYNINCMNFDNNCTSKKDFDRSYDDKYIYSLVCSDPHFFEKIIYQVNYNIERYNNYLNEFNSLINNTNLYINSNKTNKISSILKFFKQSDLKQIERQKCESIKLKVPTAITVTVHSSYTSPQGRNSYYHANYYNHIDLSNFLILYYDLELKKQSKNYQRSLMTNSLRYNILKRDGFKCCICGATANDGAKLEVDHIVPISKGGKTVPENLRTLCQACNSGKKDKYDYNGIN